MKLRNKKTGQVVTVEGRVYIDIDSVNRPEEGFKSIKEFTDIWEDYKPAEPLIKDEKIRKAVRAWADAAETTSIKYWDGVFESEQNDSHIRFDGWYMEEFGDNYTIDELCGEGEE
jgi:hypothetical protein